jgi:hypothetical protein
VLRCVNASGTDEEAATAAVARFTNAELSQLRFAVRYVAAADYVGNRSEYRRTKRRILAEWKRRGLRQGLWLPPEEERQHRQLRTGACVSYEVNNSEKRSVTRVQLR